MRSIYILERLMGSVRDAANAIGCQVDLVPAGYTAKCQILDVGVNKPFAAAVQCQFYEWLRNSDDIGKAKPMRTQVAQWVHSAWASITPQSILNTITNIAFKV